MTEVTLHPAPRQRDVVLEQIRSVGLSLRLVGLIVAVILAVGTLVIGIDLAGGGPGFDSYERFPTAIVAFLFPFAVWRNEKRFGPGFLWTLPVERRRLALARVLAGGVWFAALLAVFVSWLLVLAVVAHAPVVPMLGRVPLILTLTAYLFGSALVVGLRHPLRWLLGTVGGLLVLVNVTDLLGRTEMGEWRIAAGSPLTRPLVYGPHGLRTLLDSIGFFTAAEHAVALFETLPSPVQWGALALICFGAGFAALWAAASRHRERRRH